MHCIGFPPYINGDSEILVLGSFPSVKSREINFYYGHPQNRFWRVLSGIYGEPLPLTVEDRKSLLKRHKIALWDMVVECDIVGSMDASIKNPVIADLHSIMSPEIKKIFANGKTAYSFLEKHFPEYLSIAAYLPSTSPANGRFDMSKWEEAFNKQPQV